MNKKAAVALRRTIKKFHGIKIAKLLKSQRLAVATYEKDGLWFVGIRLFYTIPPRNEKEYYSELTLSRGGTEYEALKDFIFSLRNSSVARGVEDWLKKRLGEFVKISSSFANGGSLLERIEWAETPIIPGRPTWMEKNPKGLDYLASKALERPKRLFKKKKWSTTVDGELFKLNHDGTLIMTVNVKDGNTYLLDRAWCNPSKREKMASVLDTMRTALGVPVSDDRRVVVKIPLPVVVKKVKKKVVQKARKAAKSV